MKVVWSYPIRVDIIKFGQVRTVKPVVYCFDLPGPFDYIVPVGFECDLTSTPDALAGLAADKLESAAGSLFHDHWVRVAVPELGWSRARGDDLAATIWATPGYGSHVTAAETLRMHAAVRLWSMLQGGVRVE
jgi:hypothetical protein